MMTYPDVNVKDRPVAVWIRVLWIGEDVVPANAPPDDMYFTCPNFGAVLKCGAAIRRPGHLEDAGVLLEGPDAQTFAKSSNAKIVNELTHCG
jgi:hypothetical protein